MCTETLKIQENILKYENMKYIQILSYENNLKSNSFIANNIGENVKRMKMFE